MNNTARTLGGCITIAMCSTFLHSTTAEEVQSTPAIDALSRGISQNERQIYAASYNKQFRALLGFAGATVVTTVMLWGVRESRRRIPT